MKVKIRKKSISMNELVSVVLITLKGNIKECLEYLIAQTYSNYEIIVVSDNPDLNLSSARSLEVPIRVISNKTRVGIGRARNMGVKEARGKIVVFTDDDAIPRINWIEKLINCFDKETIAVFGRVIPKTPDISKPILRLTEFHKYMLGCNMGFRKDILSKIGLFNEKIDYGNDENDIIVRLHEKGYQIKTCKNAIIKHDFATNYLNLLWKIYKSGENSYILKGKNYSFGKKTRKILLRNIFSQKDYETLVLLSILFFIRRFGNLIGYIKRGILHDK